MTRVISLLVLLTLCACGFTPVHGQRADKPDVSNAALESIRPNVQHGDAQSRVYAEQLQSLLEKRLQPGGNSTAPLYTANISLSMTESPTATSRDGTISRYDVTALAYVTVTRLSDDVPVFNSTVRRVSSYNSTTNAYYSIYASRQSTMERTLTGLADDIRMKLAAQMQNQAELAKRPLPWDAYETQR